MKVTNVLAYQVALTGGNQGQQTVNVPLHSRLVGVSLDITMLAGGAVGSMTAWLSRSSSFDPLGQGVERIIMMQLQAPASGTANGSHYVPIPGGIEIDRLCYCTAVCGGAGNTASAQFSLQFQ